jgi:hypothetical protein
MLYLIHVLYVLYSKYDTSNIVTAPCTYTLFGTHFHAYKACAHYFKFWYCVNCTYTVHIIIFILSNTSCPIHPVHAPIFRRIPSIPAYYTCRVHHVYRVPGIHLPSNILHSQRTSSLQCTLFSGFPLLFHIPPSHMYIQYILPFLILSSLFIQCSSLTFHIFPSHSVFFLLYIYIFSFPHTIYFHSAV